MIEHVVFFLEEPSAQDFLERLLPRVLPSTITPHFLVFEGKQDLEKRLEKRLRGWCRDNSHFIVMRDQDSGDCKLIKARLKGLCNKAGKADAVVRIVCRELETFFVGDWQAVADAFTRPGLADYERRAKFRDPDQLGSPSSELARVLPQYQKRAGARKITPYLEPNRNRSDSFRVLFRSLEALTSA